MLALRACEIIACADSDKSRKDFSLRLFINPGGDLLSRDLSSDYHRRSNVSLPGSEWDRVGPLGYDHQVSDLLVWVAWGNSAYLAITCLGFAVFYVRVLLCVCCGGSRLTSAWQCVWVSKCCVSFESSFCSSKLATEGGMRSIGC